MPESQTVQAAPQEQAEVGLDGSSLLKQLLEEHKDVRLGKSVEDSFPSLDPKESKQLEAGVAEFLKYVLRNESVISRDAIRTLDAIIEILDKKLTEQLNLIMHHPNFQAVEGTWR